MGGYLWHISQVNPLMKFHFYLIYVNTKNNVYLSGLLVSAHFVYHAIVAVVISLLPFSHITFNLTCSSRSGIKLRQLNSAPCFHP